MRSWFVASALSWAAIAVMPTGCDSRCSGEYNCPAAVYGELDVPPDLTSPIATVSADSACSAFISPTSATAVIVSVKGTIAVGSTLTCQVHAQLTDGTTLTGSVTFRPLEGCCSSLSTATTNPTPFPMVSMP